jgi:hypothetical protein
MINNVYVDGTGSAENKEEKLSVSGEQLLKAQNKLYKLLKKCSNT